MVNDFCGHPFQVQLSRTLAARGYSVLHTYCDTLLTPRGALARRANDPEQFSSLAVRLDAEFDRYGLLARWRHERELGQRLAKVVQDFRPDIVISSNTPLGTQALLLEAARKNGAGFVFWMQDALGVGYRKALRRRLPLVGNLIGIAFQAYERSLLKRSDEVVAITEDFVAYMPPMVRERQAVTVIENWAPLAELPPTEKRNAWAETHGLSGTFNFVYSGTLGLKHNPELLYRLAKAVADLAYVRVVVISEGLGADWLAERKRAEGLENLLLLPFQPFGEMPNVLGSADVLIALLEKDAGAFSVPSKVLTYLCARRALLLAVPGENLSAKIVRDNEAGLTVDPDDAEGFVGGALILLEDSATREQYAGNGRAYAERAFDIEAITDRFEHIIQRVRPSTKVTKQAKAA